MDIRLGLYFYRVVKKYQRKKGDPKEIVTPKNITKIHKDTPNISQKR